MTTTRITVLVENTARGPDLLSQHGLSYWIEHEDRYVLFDTGQGHVLADNANKLGIPLCDSDALVFSHGHYDHAGGAAEALKIAPSATVYVHPAAFQRKFIRKASGNAREVGMPYASQEAIRGCRNEWVPTEQPTIVLGGLTATGPVPRLTDFEDTGGPFFLDEACTRPDPLEDDQSIYFDTAEGIVVLLGCAHSGVINTLDFIRRLTDNRPIRMVIGGMHLVNASSHRIERTIEEFKKIGVGQLSPAHCTGPQATAALWHEFPDVCIPCYTGKIYEFEASQSCYH